MTKKQINEREQLEMWTIGRPSIDPVELIKMTFIEYTFGVRSMCQTIKPSQRRATGSTLHSFQSAYRVQ